MRNRRLGLLSALGLAAMAVGGACSSGGLGNGGAAGTGNAKGGTTGTAGTTGGGGTSAGGGTSGGPTCTSVSACGGNVVGTWSVTSSCLDLSGTMDAFIYSLGCPTLTVKGSLTTTGTLIANADGTYMDNTHTTGSVTFPLPTACMSISSVPVTCDKAATIFSAGGWTTSQCTPTSQGCDCALTVDQQGALGVVSDSPSAQGHYMTTTDTLSLGDVDYKYCVSGTTLTLTPQMSALTGKVVLNKTSSTGPAGTGGTLGTGGTSSGGGTTGSGGTGVGGRAGGAGTGMGGRAGSAGTGMTGGSTGSGGSSTAGGSGSGTLPCDIYAAGGAMCVAAHSTIRALLSSFSGPLYQVKRSDGMTKDIPTLAAGGFADAAQQDTFCMGSACTITKVYDQSGHGNFVEAETTDSTVGGHAGETAASATQESLMVGGHKVYALYMKPSQAYWRDGSKTGMPLGAEPQGIYIVTSGKHFNSGCCFDYGNGETSRMYVAGRSMDALYFGNSTTWGSGAGSGPWVMADLEGGVFSGANTSKNNNLLSMTSTYVTAMEKNNGTTEFQLKASDATTGTLSTFYKGSVPGGPMKKQGSIVVGSGGDCCYSNNNASQGTIYEGAIVAGYPSDTTDAAIQANIVNVGYGK